MIQTCNNIFINIGEKTLHTLRSFGKLHMFMWLVLTQTPKLKGLYSASCFQIYNIGVLSLPIILVSGLFVGMVLGLQGYYTLVNYGAESSLGVLVALSLIRELGPVLTAILFAGRAGSSIASEIGFMKTTQQLDALEIMAIDPIQKIFQPRLLAGFIVMPMLNLMLISAGLIGAWFIGSYILGIDDSSYWTQMQDKVDWYADVMNGIIKSLFFGWTATIVALYFGYNCIPTAEGTNLATTKTVVYTSLAVLALDFILTAIMF